MSLGQPRRKPTARAGAVRSRPREKPQQIADELRRQIVAGKLHEGASLGSEPELIARFGVSRPSIREALRILEAEGLISVMRGMLGGVVVHEPDQRMTARTAATVLQARNVPLADVYEARALIEPVAVHVVASARSRRAAVETLRGLVKEQQRLIQEREAFAPANARFHEALVALAGNQTLGIVAEMLNEVVERAVSAIRVTLTPESVADRRRALRSQERLVSLIEAGEAIAAEEHWRAHMSVVGRMLLGKVEGKTVIDLMNHH
jgi:DNA-binding FadR family transcriptional regulator